MTEFCPKHLHETHSRNGELCTAQLETDNFKVNFLLFQQLPTVSFQLLTQSRLTTLQTSLISLSHIPNAHARNRYLCPRSKVNRYKVSKWCISILCSHSFLTIKNRFWWNNLKVHEFTLYLGFRDRIWLKSWQWSCLPSSWLRAMIFPFFLLQTQRRD